MSRATIIHTLPGRDNRNIVVNNKLGTDIHCKNLCKIEKTRKNQEGQQIISIGC